jgi:hypothetical protein
VGTGPPAAPPEKRSAVGTTAVTAAAVVQTLAAAAYAGRRAPAGRSVPEGPAALVDPHWLYKAGRRGRCRHHRRRHHRTRARHRAGSSSDRRRASTCRKRKYRWLDHRVSRKGSEEIKVRVGGRWCGCGGVRKNGLIKHHMARDEDPARGGQSSGSPCDPGSIRETHRGWNGVLACEEQWQRCLGSKHT